MMDRRTFIAQTGTLILGFPLLRLGAQDSPGVLDAALKRLAAENKAGLAVFVPDGAPEREALALRLQKFIETPDTQLSAAEALLFCVTRQEALGKLIQKDEKFAAVLVDSDGRRVKTFDEFDEKSELRRAIASIVPLLVHRAALAGEPEVRARCRDLVVEYFEAGGREAPGPQLPYGMKWVATAVDSCPGCGMMAPSAPAKTFLKFLTE
jgi:hypothetical protein